MLSDSYLLPFATELLQTWPVSDNAALKTLVSQIADS